MRIRLKQNYSQVYCLQQNNEDDYSTILGNVNKSYPSKMFGRGIIKRKNIYEFQTASIDTQDNVNQIIENQIKEDSSKYDAKAKSIPVLPRNVDYEFIKEELNPNTLDVIIGVEKQSLEISRYDFFKNTINVITGNDSEVMENFVNAFIEQLKYKNGFQTMLVNALDIELSDRAKSNIAYEENDFDGFFEKILKYENDCYSVYEKNNYNLQVLRNQKKLLVVIDGMDNFKAKLSLENQNKMDDFFKKAKELEVINFAFIDTIDRIKSFEYDSWFKDNFNPLDGIWIGDGINDQFTLKVAVRTDEVKETISDDFLFILRKGRPVLVKYVSDFTLEQKEDSEEMLDLD